MTERDAMDGFETRLAGLLRTHTQPAAGPIDPLATARASMTASAPGGLARWRAAALDRRLVNPLLAAALVIVLALISIAVGSLLTSDDPGRLLFVRDGDLFVANGDGTGQTRIAEGNADDQALGYISALWSPDGIHIAAVRDEGAAEVLPRVDILTNSGSLVGTVTLDPGGPPAISWSPDGKQLAVAALPGQVSRDAGGDVLTGFELLVVDLAGLVERQVPTQPEWRSFVHQGSAEWGLAHWNRIGWSANGHWIAIEPVFTDDLTVAGQVLLSPDGSTDMNEGDRTELASAKSLDWVPGGGLTGVLATGAEPDCPGRSLGLGSQCLPVLWIFGPNGGSVVVNLMLTTGDPYPAVGSALLSPLSWSPDGGLAAAVSLRYESIEDETGRPSRSMSALWVFDADAGRYTQSTSGVTEESGGVLTSVTGSPPAWGPVVWTQDGQRILYLVPEPGGGPARWTIRSIDAAGGSPSEVLVEGVQSFDLADR